MTESLRQLGNSFARALVGTLGADGDLEHYDAQESHMDNDMEGLPKDDTRELPDVKLADALAEAMQPGGGGSARARSRRPSATDDDLLRGHENAVLGALDSHAVPSVSLSSSLLPSPVTCLLYTSPSPRD